ncbi:malectin domain-containing carbohydrate-binding protein [Vallicoccus soli]|uniref:malectin domain-containing carbohydrate-binding protein n=1 Tax=Vallicoccus soli TaxID=2339232 RepID=UPI001C498815|nr:malectin domain-containing carbohydrate-binding protein [Vallicoccus soli]
MSSEHLRSRLAASTVVTVLLGMLATMTPALAGVARAAVTPDLSVKVNFQPDASAVPAGFTKDTGAAFDGARGYGWVRQDSLQGAHVPFGVPLNTRDRSTCTALTPQQRTFVHMQAPATNATNNATPVAWDHALPNGTYEVTVGVGDANLGNDAESHTVNVEGVPVVSGFARSTAANCTPSRLTTGTTSVTVTDGVLTVDAVGGTNTKLQYVTIESTPNPVASVSATSGTSGVSLDWDDAEGATAYEVFTSATLPVPTTGTPAATVTGSAYEDTTAPRGTVRYYAVASVDADGVQAPAALAWGMPDAAEPTALPLPVQVNFSSQAGPAVTGYLKDHGQNYANDRGYGWVVPGTRVPLNLVGNGRVRTEAGLDPRLASLMHMQADDVPAPAAGTIKQEGAWQLAVPAGSYDVEVAVGDASPGSDPTTHRLRVEGTVAVDRFPVTSTTTGAARFRTATLTGVQVADGFLTVDAEGGTNTKIDYITVTPTPADAKPAAPTGLTATAGDARVALDWADGGEDDLAGYDVFRSTGTTVPTTGTPLNGDQPLGASAFEDTTAANDTTYRYAVVAVDRAGQRSAASATVTATPDAAAPAVAELPLRVDFVDQAGAAVEGYRKDYGQAFGNARGSGWVEPGTHEPLSLAAAGRTRPARAGVTPLQASILHMQGSGLTTNATPDGSYEVAVPNGAYAVTVGVGDQAGAARTGCPAPCYDSVHRVLAEGEPVVDGFQATAAQEFATRTAVVEVADGRLTLDATGGTNTKITHLEVEVADTAAPAAPAGFVADGRDGLVHLAWDAVEDADLAGYHVYRATGSDPELVPANRVTPAPRTGRTYDDSAVQNGTSYRYAVTAVDAAGNESAPVRGTATPADRTAPPAVADLVAVAGVESVALRWTPSTATDVSGYRVYRATGPIRELTDAEHVGSSPTPAYLDEGLTNGTTYHYVVVAVDTAGNVSALPAGVEATPTAAPDTEAPAAPTGLAATAGDARVELAWTASTSGDVVGYDVFRAATADGAGTKLNALPLTATAFTDATALNGTTYHYYVTASDLAGNASGRSGVASATPRDTTAPAAPRGVTATAGPASVTLRWTANTEPDLRGYRIYRSTTASVPTDEEHLVGLLTGRTGRTFLDSDLEPGTTYHYVLTAEDQLRNASAPSAVASATPTAPADTTAPAAPTGLSATVDGTDVRLAWTAVTATDLAGYNVYRSTGTAPRVKVNAAPVTATSATDSGAPAGSTSTYVVTAVDRSGNESVASGTATATPAQPALSAKVDFQTAAGAAAPGYTKDTGAAFSVAAGQGWVRQDSLAGAAHTPLDLSANTRDRARAGVDERLDSVIHMQYGDIVPLPTGNGNLTSGAWEKVVPNGRYTVTVGVGDQPGNGKTGCPAPCYDSTHTVRVEGVTAVDAFQATAAQEYETGTVTVDVTDGLLTVDAVGGNNTKLGFVDIASAGPVLPDTTPPAAPSGLSALPGDGSATLTWGASTSSDAVAYNVYRGATDVVVPSAASKVNTSPVVGLSLTDTGLTNGTTYHYVVTAVDQAGNESAASAVRSVVPAPGTGTTTVKVNFQDEATTPPAGYLADWGQAFGPRTSTGQGTGQSYGWVGVGTGTPLSLVGNGRNRNVASSGMPAAGLADLRMATFLHMQLPATVTGGVKTPGSWELAVPNGAYVVTVAVGDAGTPVDSTNWIGIENQNAIAAHVPTATAKSATATRTVVVSDGRLTLSPAGGTNTKIDYVDVVGVDRGGRPFSTAVTPANGATGVVTNASVTTDNALNPTDGAVDETSLGGGNVRLVRVLDGTPVAGRGVTSGGGDTVSFQADAPLSPSTLYRFEITEAVKDKGGRSFLPFSSVFTTAGGTGTEQPPGTVRAAFDKAASGASAGKMYTSVVVGPDGKLYAGSITGQIYRWTIGQDGTLSGEQVIDTVRTHAVQRGWEGAPNRTVIGMAFDPASTPSNPVLWITDNYAYLGQDVPNATGAISRLSGPNLENYQEVAVNLPRSIKDHETNSIAIRDGKLYVTQGSMNAMGATDGTWKRPEHLLSAAVLELDPAKLPAQLPVDVATPDLQAPARSGVPAHTGTYDPYAPGAPLTLYATGVRNAYDLVWHSNGHLYSGTNGSAAGGNTPATPNPLPASCANRPDGGYSGPSAPAITGNRQAETDYVFDVRKGKYYGHPNPVRCEYVLNAGNPNGYTGNPLFKVNAYPLGQAADPNYDLAGVYDAGLHASANGTIEYKNTRAFGGAFAGKLVVVRYSANQELAAFDVDAQGALSAPVTGLTGFTGFRQPLDVAEDVATGNLYVTELTDNPATTGIVLLKPQGGAGSTGRAEVTERLVFSDVQGGAASAAQQVTVRNTGGGALTVGGASATGTDAARFTVGTPSKPFPAVLQPGETMTIPVAFAPTTAGPRTATLSVSSDDPRSATATTRLRGLGTLGTGGSNEPSLQWILQTLEVPVQTGDPDPTNNDMPATSGMLGDEVAVQSFTKAAFDHPVEVQPLSLYGPDGPAANPYVVTVAAHTTGRPAERTVLFRGPNSSNQQLLPAVTDVGEYDLETPFGLDFTWHGLSNRVAYSEDALNTWGGATPHKVRVYPLKDAAGALVPNAYVVAPEDVPSPVDYQDAVLVLRNVKPATTTGPVEGKVTTSVPELVFSGVRGTTIPTRSVVVTNETLEPVTVTPSVTGTHAGAFALVGGAQEVAAGATATFQVRFAPTSAQPLGHLEAALRIATTSTGSPLVEVGLHGLATPGEQGGNEPPLKAVVDTLGHPVDVGGTGLILGTGAAPIGEEVAAQQFVKAGTAPVTLTPVARYSPDEVLPFGWYPATAGDPELREVGVIALDNEQTLNPAVQPGGSASFDPGTAPFGLYVDSKSFGRVSYTQDGLNVGAGRTVHAARTWPAKDRSGKVVPGTYLVGFEDATNGDYQDYLFRITGVRPAADSATGTALARVDFTTPAGPVAAGYTADSGAPYSDAAGRGWVRPGTGTPLDMGSLTRERTGTAEQRSRTLVLMQPTATQSPNGDGAWELAVPNGTYTVTVEAGDASFTDSVHTVRVEGQVAVAGFVPTTATPFQTGRVTVPVSDGRLTVDAVGGTNTKVTYVDVDRTTVTGDTTAPTVTATVSGLQQSAGTFKNTATVTVTATDAGSGVASTSYSLDGGAFRTYTGPVEVTTTGAHTVRARAVDVAGNIATSATTTFSVVTAAPSTANVVLENVDGVPFADRLVMNRIQNPETGKRCRDTAACDPVTGPFFPVNGVHDVATLRIRNTGTDALNVTGLAVTGPFALVDPQAAPALVAAGASLDVPVRFTATAAGSAAGLWTGSLTVTTDDVDEPSLPVELAGFWQSQSEGGQEPDLTEITRLFGYRTAITSAGQSINQQGLVTAVGDEVLSPYWVRTSATAPVTVRQLAAFHTQGNTATIGWHAKGSSSVTNVVTHAGVDGQSVLPHRNGSTTQYASGTFSPAGAFGLRIDSEWSDPARNNSAVDVENGCVGTCGHHMRFWPVRDRAGAVVPGSWIVAMDYSGINYDYQDNVYLVTGMRPELAVDPAAPAPVPGASSLQLGFDAAVPGTVADKDGTGTGFTSVQRNKQDTTGTTSSYQAPLLDVVTSAPGTLAVTSNGGATTGSNAGTDNTLVNGLQTAFDGTAGTFAVTGRLLGPVAGFDAGSEQAGVMLGANQDNFVKVAVINRSGVPSIELYAEQGGTGATVGTAVPVPGPATVGSLELVLIGDATAGTVRAAYRVDGGTLQVLPTAWTVPAGTRGTIFDAQSKAGLIVAHKGGAAFTATYDSFAVTAGDPTAGADQREALHRLDVAGSAPYTDSKGQVWTTDAGRYSPATAPAEGASTTQEIAGTTDDVLYRTYRGNVGNVAQDQRVLTYALPTRAAGTVDLRLHFAERAAGNNAVGRRVFDIEAEGKVVRRGFDVYAAAGGLNTAVVLPVRGVTVTDGVLDLAFRATADYPSIAAIEVLCQGTCPVDTTAPAAPTGLAATASTTGVALDWADNGEADVVGYDVYRATGTGAFAKLTATPVRASAYTDSTAAPSTAYGYRVVALDSSDNASAASATATVTTPAPPAPTSVRINAGGAAQTVGGTTWSACAATTACSGWVSGGFAYSEADTVTGIPAGLNNAVFQTEWTGGATGTGVVPVGQRAFGFDVPVVNGPYAVRLHFAELNKTGAGQRTFDVRLEGSTVLTAFDVWAAAGGIDRAVVREFPVTVTDGKVTIDFLRRVENAKVSAIEILPVLPDTTAPGAPAGLTATGALAGNTLSWTARTEADLAGYNVYRASSPTGTYTKLNGALLTGTTFSDTAAPVDAASSYQVTAVDRAGNESARSATATATRPAPDTTPPAVVTGLTATGSATGVALSWSASTAGDLAGYTVYRSSAATGPWTALTTSLITGTTFADPSAPQGAASYYQVTATDRSGNQSARSATASATRPDTTAPAAVTGLTATGSQTGIALSWGASTAGDLAGYSVYRASSATGTYTKLGGALLTGTTFTDTTAPAGAASWYQVTATDTAGNESPRPAAVSATRPGTTTQQPVRINAGGGAVTTGGVSWLADQWFTGGKSYSNAQVSAIAGTTDDVLYRTERSATGNLVPFSYGIPVANGTYTVRLHFAEIYFGATGGGAGGTGKRVLSANIEGGPVEVANLDLNAVAAPMTAVVREFQVPVTDGRVDIAFSSTVNQAKVSAIEVLPVTTTPPARPTVRINAGGPAQTVGGTTWAACSSTTACSGRVSGGFAHTEDDTITGLPAGTNQALYRSEWTGGATAPGAVVPVGSRAFGFDVPVTNGAYTVRLHFAELNKTGVGQRVFDVRLEGTEVLSRFDVRAAAGAIDRAVVREFPVTITDGRVTIDFIRRVENAKVSAIEIVPVG